jgi:hypothetical protein
VFPAALSYRGRARLRNPSTFAGNGWASTSFSNSALRYASVERRGGSAAGGAVKSARSAPDRAECRLAVTHDLQATGGILIANTRIETRGTLAQRDRRPALVTP